MTDVTICGSETHCSEISEQLSKNFPEWDIETVTDEDLQIKVHTKYLPTEELQDELDKLEESSTEATVDYSQTAIFLNYSQETEY